MEIGEQDNIIFLGMKITKRGDGSEISIHKKTTNSGLLLHYHSHVMLYSNLLSY